MSFMEKLKKIVAGNEKVSAEEVEALKAERRYNERLNLSHSSIIQVNLGKRSYNLMDISYGGVGIYLNEDDLANVRVGETLSGEIVAPKGTIGCGFQSARFGKDPEGRMIGGLVFHHESRASLVFLRDVIEPLQQGRTLAKVREEHLRSEKREAGDCYYRGAGPCDLAIAKNGSFSLTFILSTGQYGELAVRGQKLHTSITLPHTNLMPGHQIAATETLDMEILQHGSLILAGGCTEHGEALNPCLQQVQALFHSWRTQQSA